VVVGCGIVCDARWIFPLPGTSLYLVTLIYISDIFLDVISRDIDVYICYISCHYLVILMYISAIFPVIISRDIDVYICYIS
jgi:hypothetical protein